MGFSNAEILSALFVNHQINMSLRTLHRRLRECNIYRRTNHDDELHVAMFIESQLLSGSTHGYRWMHRLCTKNGIYCSRETVRLLMTLLDESGVNTRRARRLQRRAYSSKGPNDVWHTDCYDKLKPYGLCISGAIDGYSRKIIWLKVHHTSSDPLVIAGYYVEALRDFGGCPAKLRSDEGTENIVIGTMQSIIGGSDSYIFGSSTTNQRIESYWCMLRKTWAQKWMNAFESLKDDGSFTGSFIDKNLIQFCFMSLIEVSRELDLDLGL